MTAMPRRGPAVLQCGHAACTFVAFKTRQDVRFNVRRIKGLPSCLRTHARAGMHTLDSAKQPRTYLGVGPGGVPLHEQGHDLAPESGRLPLYAAPADYAVQLQDTRPGLHATPHPASSAHHFPRKHRRAGSMPQGLGHGAKWHARLQGLLAGVHAMSHNDNFLSEHTQRTADGHACCRSGRWRHVMRSACPCSSQKLCTALSASSICAMYSSSAALALATKPGVALILCSACKERASLLVQVKEVMYHIGYNQKSLRAQCKSRQEVCAECT